VRSWHFS